MSSRTARGLLRAVNLMLMRSKPLLPPVLQEDCTTDSTDAAGYAADIDEVYTKMILSLWLLMAVVFTGSAVVFDRTPACRADATWVRDARGSVFPGCRPGKGAISPLLAGYQKRGWGHRGL
ncbi:conjugal transfer protein TraP [Raoultella planticola]|uniref:Conjugal transfer protein TraP n=1 Tax=Raoultella planticola TaxID=575 RepID=A0A485D525_RAOPL|nr:conjugal transfer protein TraP [Raoultella planticola]